MLRLIARQKEILHARIEIGKITVRSAGGVEAVIPLTGNTDEVRALGRAGYTLLQGGFTAIVPDGRPYTILVRRRLAGWRHDQPKKPVPESPGRR